MSFAVDEAQFHSENGNRKAGTADYADYADCLTMYNRKAETGLLDVLICEICEICGFMSFAVGKTHFQFYRPQQKAETADYADA